MSLKCLRAYPFAFLALSLLLTGCNLPQAAGSDVGSSSRRQTEIAGILNPEGLLTGTQEPEQPVQDETRPGWIRYLTQQGDTLSALAARFEVDVSSIQADQELPTNGLLAPGLSLWIPDALEETLPNETPFFPDSAITYGPSVGEFNAADFAIAAGGFLAGYVEIVNDMEMSGAGHRPNRCHRNQYQSSPAVITFGISIRLGLWAPGRGS